MRFSSILNYLNVRNWVGGQGILGNPAGGFKGVGSLNLMTLFFNNVQFTPGSGTGFQHWQLLTIADVSPWTPASGVPAFVLAIIQASGGAGGAAGATGSTNNGQGGSSGNNIAAIIQYTGAALAFVVGTKGLGGSGGGGNGNPTTFAGVTASAGKGGLSASGNTTQPAIGTNNINSLTPAIGTTIIGQYPGGPDQTSAVNGGPSPLGVGGVQSGGPHPPASGYGGGGAAASGASTNGANGADGCIALLW